MPTGFAGLIKSRIPYRCNSKTVQIILNKVKHYDITIGSIRISEVSIGSIHGVIMKHLKRLGIGLLLVAMLVLSVLVTMTFAGDPKGGRGPGDLHPHSPITGNVLYTPILLDFESDGKIEIIVGSHDTIRCLEDPDGDGVWTERWSERIGSSIHNSPNIADIDDDGEVEVLIISESADSLFALDNHGNIKWQFSYREHAGYSDCHSSVASGDLNFDGTLETLFSCQSSGEMLVVSEHGTKDNIGGGAVSSGGWHSSPAIGELDGLDQSLEFIHQGAAGTIFAKKMGGANLWERNIFPPTTNNPSPAIGDLDQDGRNEVIVVSESSNYVYCLEGATGNELWSFQMASGSMSSAALADLDVDELWEVIIGDTSGNLYCIDYEGHEVWKTNLGASIKPSPAIADIDSDGLLEVVEVSNDGTCWAVDDDGSVMWSYPTGESIPTSSVTADPSPVIGDIDSDGYLEVLFATGSGTLRVLETDGQVPSSALPWPMFRYDREHTGFYNGTLEYGASLTVDEDNTPPGIQSPLIRFIQPGQTAQYNLTLTNVGHQSVIVGMFKDRFTLSVKDVPDNWSASLTAYNVPINEKETVHHDPHFEQFERVEEIEHIQLGEGGSIDFTLRVTAPKANVSFGDFAAIEAFAMSETDNNATDTITTTTFLDLVVDLAVNIIADEDPFTGKKVDTISAGADKMLQVEVANIGNLNDTYDVSIRSGIPSGWTVSFSSNDPTDHDIKDIFVPCKLFGIEDSAFSLPLYVHCPPTASMDEHVDITITGTSQLSENSLIETVVRDDTVEMVVKETNLLNLEIMEPVKNVDPGETVAFTAVLTNRGNTRASVGLTLLNPDRDEDKPAGERWFTYWEESSLPTHSVALRQHEPVPLKIIVRAPESAVAGSRIVMDVKAENLDDSSVVTFKQITAIVNEKYEYMVNFSDTAGIVVPGSELEFEVMVDTDKDGILDRVNIMGKMITYNFTITSTGNSQDEIQLYVKDLPTVYWAGYFMENNVEVSELLLDIGESRDITFVVMVPASAEAGLFDLGMTFRGKGDVFEEGISAEDDPRYRTVKLTVMEIYDMTIETVEKTELDFLDELDIQDVPAGMVIGRNVLYVDIDPASESSYVYRVTNRGNTEDWFRITASPVRPSTGEEPDDWELWFSSIANRRTASLTENMQYQDFSKVIDLVERTSPVNYITKNRTSEATVKLGMGESAWITLGAGIPMDQVAEVISVDVDVASWNLADGEARRETQDLNNRARIVFRIANSDLQIISDLLYEDELTAGETYSVGTTIANYGSIQAEDVLVVFKVDGETVDAKYVQLIGTLQEARVYFHWTATGGEHLISVEIDPDGDVIESNDHYRGSNNNVIKEKVVVDDSAFVMLGLSARWWGIFGAVALGGVLLIIAVGLPFMRK